MSYVVSWHIMLHEIPTCDITLAYGWATWPHGM